jgi:cytochrome bd-type quinol oxidase subunit 2
MATGLLHFHHYFRYIVLILLIISIVKAISGLRNTGEVKSRKLEMYTLTAFHIQILFGILLLFVSPLVKASMADMSETMVNPALRLRVVEHPVLMLVSAIIITIGYVRSKKKTSVPAFSRTILISYGITLLLVLSRIPMDSWFFS